MKPPITYLFVPGNRPERFDKAVASGADAVIVDLEDAVAPPDKDAARDQFRRWLESTPAQSARIVVRINDAGTPWFAGDLALVASGLPRCVMLPKAEAGEQIAVVHRALGGNGAVIPIIESARGVEAVDAVAATAGVARLAFGTLDYAVDLDLSGDERGLIYPASRIAIASRVAGLPAPIAGVTASVDDEAALLADVAFARAAGFGAKLCIHPRQVAAVERAMRPSGKDVDWARRIVAAADGGTGVVVVDGRMVDRPVLLRARAILDRTAE